MKLPDSSELVPDDAIVLVTKHKAPKRVRALYSVVVRTELNIASAEGTRDAAKHSASSPASYPRDRTKLLLSLLMCAHVLTHKLLRQQSAAKA